MFTTKNIFRGEKTTSQKFTPHPGGGREANFEFEKK